jgi:SAM-dependent methyltransferase
MYNPNDYWTHIGVTRLYDDKEKRRFELEQQNKINSIISQYGVGSVLEIGCGYGRILAKIKCDKVEGIDLSEVLLEQCRKENPNIKVGYGDVTKYLSYPDNSLLHIKPEDVEKAINEMYRVARKVVFFNTYFEEQPTLEMPYWCFLHQYKIICDKLSGIKTYEKVGKYGLDVLIGKVA